MAAVVVAWALVSAAAVPGAGGAVGLVPAAAPDTPVDTAPPEPTPTAEPTDTAATSTPTPTSPATQAPSLAPTPTSGASPSRTPSPSATPTPTRTERPATPPAVRSTGISLGSALLALAVLVGSVLVLWAAYRQGTRRGATAIGPAGQSAAPEGQATVPAGQAAGLGTDIDAGTWAPPVSQVATDSPVAFLVALGEAMIDSGDPVTHVGTSLRRVAQVYGVEGAQVIVLPTALIVSVPGTETIQTAVASPGSGQLRLDQIDAVFQVAGAAERGEIGAREGLARLRLARAMAPTFGPLVRVLGYTVLTLGIALILRAGWTDLLVAGSLGAAVGSVQLGAGRIAQAYQAFLPVGCAFGVSVTVFLLGRAGLDMGVFAPLVAPLVTFLPGGLLTTSVIELSTGQMISGAGRLAAGAMQLVLLALGIVSAAQLVGVPATSVVAPSSLPLGELAPWIGVAVFGVGVVVHHGARPASLGWIVLVLYVAYAGQVIGGLLFGGVLSAFFGALLMTPVALFAATQKSGPPTLVSFLPAFWLLVPGALGLIGVTRLLGDDRVDGTTSLVTAGVTMVGIALGVLLGLAAATGLASGAARLSRRRR